MIFLNIDAIITGFEFNNVKKTQIFVIDWVIVFSMFVQKNGLKTVDGSVYKEII